jgi:phage terminase Nu1 subunit (DNA packaging protein)
MRKPYIVNKAGMAQLFGVSLKTVDDWIRKGAPVLKPGSNGVSYEIDSGPFVEWVRAHRAGISIAEFRKRDQQFHKELADVTQKGAGRRSYKFNSADVLAWREGRDAEGGATTGSLTSEQVRRRYTLANAELKEMQLAEKRGELVSISAVTATLADELTAVRGRLLAMPGRLAGQLAIISDPAEIEAAIDEEVRGALTELSTGS